MASKRDNAIISLGVWGTYEGIGDKLTSLQCYRLFQTYKLPFSWINTLHEIFTSNNNWKKIFPAFNIPDNSDLLLSEADTVEVFFPFNFKLKFWHISEF